MLLVVLIALIVIGIVMYEKLYRLEICGISISCISIIISILMIIYSVMAYIAASATQEEMRQEYKALVYKVEAESARDEFGIRNKDIIDEVQKWNTDLAFEKAIQRNFWIGIFEPNIYDEFEFIELP